MSPAAEGARQTRKAEPDAKLVQSPFDGPVRVPNSRAKKGGRTPQSLSACAACGPIADRIERYRGDREAAIQLLGRNHKFLARVNDPYSTRAMKAHSNVKILLGRLDVLKHALAKTETEADQKGCGKCRTIDRAIAGN